MSTTPGTAGVRADEAMERVGEVVDSRYRITALLGQGGMGSVYRAEHIKIRRPVAIKLLNKELRRFPEISERLEREAFATGRLQHPNCVAVSDCGHMDDGTVYLVMELLDGRELGDELDEHGALGTRRALHIARQMLKGLAHAHEAEVVHRDIKPDNIVLVDQDGDPDFVKILDFGIAKLLGDAMEDAGGKQLTQAGLAVGTPYYMSPEQAFGSDIDGRSDIYSASVVLYEMLSGMVPFDADDKLQILSMHVSRQVPPFAEINPEVDVPPAVERLVMRGLAKKPADRYRTAREYVAAIDAVLASLPDRAESPQMPFDGLTPVPRSVTGFSPSSAGDRRAQPLATPAPTAHLGLPAPRRRRRSLTRNQLLGVGAGGAAVLMVIILAATAGSSKDDGEFLPAKSDVAEATHEPSELSREAQRILQDQGPARAIALLESNSEAVSSDPDAQLVLGHAHAGAQHEPAAAAAYTRAVKAHPPLATDEIMRTNLSRWLEDGGRDTVDAATELMRAIIETTGDRGAQERVIDVASRHATLYTRYKAFTLAEELGIDGKIDRLQSYLLDLEQSPKCEYRRRTVDKLRELGDKKAIPALTKAQKRYVRGGLLGLSSENANGCLVKDAQEAIEHLESL